MLALFSITIFLGAALLFLVQPMAAKLILPRLGGTPGVWNGCMVLFQAALLGGYAYAHFVGAMKPGRRPLTLHALALTLATLTLPVGIRAFTEGLESSPLLAVVTMLAVGFGAPFLMMSTGGSLVQRWFSTTDHPQARDPYFLYAASNAGSLLGLLGYPLLVEPTLTLSQQRWGWSAGYVVWAGLTIACLVAAMRRPGTVISPAAGTADPEPATDARDGPGAIEPPATTKQRWVRYTLWIALAAVPSSLVLGATQHITMDLGAIPLLWVVPLAVYLVTFIVAFSPKLKGLTTIAAWGLIPVLALVALVWQQYWKQPILWIVSLHMLAVFFGALACHGKLASMRPRVEDLTKFYLCLALGGVLGGSFNALVAPYLLIRMEEYPIALFLALALGFPTPASWKASRLTLARVAVSAAAACALLWTNLRNYQTQESTNILHTRSFYGVLRVRTKPDTPFRRLMHGNTLHGFQAWADPELRKLPSSYYYPTGPIGDLFALPWPQGMPMRAGFVGLGAGSLAAYSKDKSQHFTFYEIDQEVINIAFDPRYFTFTTDSRATVDSVAGDARLSLVKEPDSTFDLLVLDAFSSDAIPVHLLTVEAGKLYRSKLKPTGVMAFHITNRYLDLRGPLGALAKQLGVVAMYRNDTLQDATPGELNTGRLSCKWVVMGTPGPWVGMLRAMKWERIDDTATARAWTDDFSDVLTVFWKTGPSL